MWSTAREIAEGDVVIIWQTREAIQPLVVTPGKELQTRFGAYRHSDFVGIPYGSKVGSWTGRGFIHVLRPTPELWTTALPHRTQILYLADIAFIVSYLDIKPGSTVIEAGTGSGSFSHSVARTIGSSGKLYSYEFHEPRAIKAREEFESHGLADIITLTHRNVCKDGFTVIDRADSIFLDLPAPWEAIEHAKKALRKDRVTRICCFSPCIEQVLRTVAALNDAGFTDVTMYETLIRPHEVHNPPALQSITVVSEKLKQSEIRREEKRQKQIASSARKALEKAEGKKRKLEEAMAGEAQQETEITAGNEEGDGEAPEKRARTGTADPADAEGEQAGLGAEIKLHSPKPSASDADAATPLSAPEGRYFPPKSAPIPAVAFVEAKNMVVSRVPNEVRGHTSYLTFASLLPSLQSLKKPVVVDGNENKGSQQANGIGSKSDGGTDRDADICMS